MNMRKIIAVLAAALMLCAIVPTSVFAAPGDVIVNKNFDDGSVFANARAENGYMVFDATTANWANVYLYANAIKSGNKYEITFDAKANKATNVNVKINNNWAHDTFAWTTNVTTEWETYTCVINPDELNPLTSTALLLFTSNTNAADGAVYHIDNVVVKEYAEPVAPGSNLIVNGDFEKGDLSGWNKHQQTVISTDAAKSGSYGAYLNGNSSSWGGVLDQTINVEDGKTYTFSFDYKAVRQGFNWTLSGVQSSTKYAGSYVSATSWTHFEKEITVVNDTQLKINFNCGGQTGTDEMYVDNVSLKEVKDPSFDGYVYNGDFEAGAVSPWTVYAEVAVDADAAKDGDYGLHIKYPSGGWGGTAYQDFATEIGKTYVVMMDAKALSKGQNIQIQNPIGTSVTSKWFTTTNWTTLSFQFTATATNTRINICGGGTGVNEEIYVDNVFVFEKKDTSNDGYIINGDFETGTMEGLAPSQQTCISRDAAKDGNFGLKMLGNGGWGGVGQWTINGLEAGATYKIEMDMNAIEQGFNWTLWQDVVDSGVKYASGYFSTKAWTHIEKEFVANSAVAVLNINGGGNGNAETVYLDNLKITLVAPAHTHEYDNICDVDCNTCGETREVSHNVAHVEAKDATCYENGNIEYWYCETCGAAWLDAECTLNTNLMAVILPMGHGTITHVEAKDATCYENGNIEYWFCETCGQAWLDAECTLNTNLLAVVLPMGHGTITHVEAVEATCTTLGNIEYWYCEACGQAWLDAECTMNTNLMAVKLPMADHTYDDEYDADCNDCGAIREAKVLPVTFGGNSVSQDVSGLAFKFDMTIEGMAVIEGTGNHADYANATIDGYKLNGMGALASNGAAELTIPAKYLFNLKDSFVSFAVRIINIPEDHLDTEITVTPYFVVEIEEGVETTIYGDEQIANYNAVLNVNG